MFALPLGRAAEIRSQRQRGWKLDSFHAPEAECVGKASAPYEFGVKGSVATTKRRAPGGQLVLHASALPDNPYDGDTLRVLLKTPRHSPDARSSGPMSTRVTAAMTRRTRAASLARSGVSSEPSCASCVAVPPSSP